MPARVDFPDRFISSTQLRQILGGKSSDMLSEHGLNLLIKAGVIPTPLRFGRYLRWRWSAVDAAIKRLEAQQQPTGPVRAPRRRRAAAEQPTQEST